MGCRWDAMFDLACFARNLIFLCLTSDSPKAPLSGLGKNRCSDGSRGLWKFRRETPNFQIASRVSCRNNVVVDFHFLHMTYTVIGRCARTHEIGIGVATYSLACGSFIHGADSGFGVAMTQANVRKGNATISRALMAQGFSSRSVVDALVRDDAHEALRQIAVMTRDGIAAVHTGERVQGWAGSKAGPDYVVFGNVLAGEQVIEAMAGGFCSEPQQPLAERLIRSLEHGRDAGGQGYQMPRLPERSACLLVTGRKQQADWDLRVDLHPTAVEELRRLYEVFACYQAYYNDRDEDPSRCLSQVAWESKHLTEHQLEEFLK